MGQLIYIMGCRKSGTTLLQHYFRCAQDMVVVNGEIPPVLLLRVQAKVNDETKNIVARRCSRSALWMASFCGNDPAGMNSKPRVYGGQTVVADDEQDDALPWLDFLDGRWKELSYVFIRRDPRDVMTHRTKGAPTFQSWKNAEAALTKLKGMTEKVFEIKYEDLFVEGLPALVSLFEEIGLTLEVPFVRWPTRLNLSERNHPSVRWIKHDPNEDSVGCWNKTDAAKSIIREQLALNPDLPQVLIDHRYEINTRWTEQL